MAYYSDLIWPMAFNASLVSVMVFGFIGFALGVGLIVSSAKTLRVLQSMNRWVSMRSTLKPVEVPRDFDGLAHKYRYWVGVPLIAGGLFATFGLVARINASAVSATFSNGATTSILAIAAEALRWFLVLGSIAGVVIGILLCYSPAALGSMEKYANRWISSRQLTRGSDDMHSSLDRLVAARPGPSGWIFTCTGLGVVIYAAFLLLARH